MVIDRRVIGYFCMAGCLINFVVCSMVGPGVIKKKNLTKYMVFPYDNVLYSPRDCTTCKISK